MENTWKSLQNTATFEKRKLQSPSHFHNQKDSEMNTGFLLYVVSLKKNWANEICLHQGDASVCMKMRVATDEDTF